MSDLSFNQIPLDILTPGIYMEIDPSLSKSGLTIFKQRTVIWGQMGNLASATAGVMETIITQNDAKMRYGVDSMLYGMVKRFREINPYQELLVIPLAENAAGNKATGTITIAGIATSSSTQPFYIAGIRYQLGVAVGEAASDIAGRLASLINNNPTSLVIATNIGAMVTLTCKWRGETGNDISIFDRYHSDDYGTQGLNFTIAAMSGGTGNPDITTALDVIDDVTQYQAFINPYTDTSNMIALRAELDERWGPLQAIDGRVFCALRDNVAANSAFAASMNNQNIILVDSTMQDASPSWEIAASFAANVMYYGTIDPGRPFQTLELNNIMGAPLGSRRVQTELEMLLQAGLSTLNVMDDGKVRIQRAVTTYGQNEAGATDAAYKSLNTVMLLSYYRRSIINRFKLRYPRHKLALSNNPAAGAASNIITPKIAEAEFIAHYKLMIDAGLMDDMTGYKADIIAQKNTINRGRCDVFDQPRPIDQFHQLAVRTAFRLI